MRILFCGGGTGGHIMPAIAIAESFKKYAKNTEFVFVGRDSGDENRAVTNNGFPLTTIKIHGFERKISFENIKNVLTAYRALGESKRILKTFKPDAVIGTGGYVTWPVISVASKMKIPTAIHESNACPGLVTKMLSKKTDFLLLNLSGSENYFKNKNNIHIVGNPVRNEFTALDRQTARKKLGLLNSDYFILSFGGSGGSEKINETVLSLMKSHSSKNQKVKHVHASGIKYFDKIKKQNFELISGKHGCVVKPYIDDIPTMMMAADTVISRCGAMTIAELSASGVPAILIPSPNVTNDHQYKNAKLICERGGGILIEEKDLNERRLLDEVRKLENSEKKRQELSKNIKKFYIKDSADSIRDLVLELTKKRKREQR